MKEFAKAKKKTTLNEFFFKQLKEKLQQCQSAILSGIQQTDVDEAVE